MKGLLVRLVRILVRIFYRRVETAGLANVPPAGPVLFVANHVNGLVDPMLVLAALDRPVVFVAKSTLWKIPVLRRLLDALDVVPVVRRVDAAEEGNGGRAGRNEESLARLAGVLRSGGAVLIFPEGRSHSDPSLSPPRTGAARILLLAGVPAAVVPLGLWYTRKEEFRSDVLIRAGTPLTVPHEPTVEGWTEAIRTGLESVTLNAGDWEGHEIAAAVEVLYGESLAELRGGAGAGTTGKGTTGVFSEGEERSSLLDSSFQNRKLLLAARRTLDRIEPKAVAQVARRARALDHFLRRIGLSPAALDAPPEVATVLAHTIRALLVVLLGFPVAVLGVVAWWVPYRLCGFVANRLPGAAEHRDQISLYKLLSGIVFFPVTLGLWTTLAARLAGPWVALAIVAVLPPAGLLTLRYLEHAQMRESQARDLLAVAVAPGGLAPLRAERDALRAECDRLAEVYALHAADTSDNPPP